MPALTLSSEEGLQSGRALKRIDSEFPRVTLSSDPTKQCMLKGRLLILFKLVSLECIRVGNREQFFSSLSNAFYLTT
jgi:hypothetical protein